jgi:hypothetical protein
VDLAERGLERPAPFVHEEQLVAAGVAIEIVHPAIDVGDGDDQILVAEDRDAAVDGISADRGTTRQPVAIARRLVRLEVGFVTLPSANLEGRRRRPQVIEQRVRALEAFGREEFLGVQAAVRPAELDVTLRRDGARSNVGWHPRPFVRARSSALAGCLFHKQAEPYWIAPERGRTQRGVSII